MTDIDTSWHAKHDGVAWYVCRRDEAGRHYLLRSGLTMSQANMLASESNLARGEGAADALMGVFGIRRAATLDAGDGRNQP